MNDPISFVEFGSGRGQLTYWVAKATGNKDLKSNVNGSNQQTLCTSANFVLIDKASHRHKFDNKLIEETPQLNTARIRVDIEDVVLGKIDALSDRVSDVFMKNIAIDKCQILMIYKTFHDRG